MMHAARPQLRPRAPVPRHRTRLHSPGLRNHLLALPRLRHHRRHSHLRRHRLQRHRKHAVLRPTQPLLELPLRSALRLLHDLHRPGQVQADASHDHHRHRRLHRQLLREHEVFFQRTHCVHIRRIHHWGVGKPVQPPPSRRCCCGASSRSLRPGPRQSRIEWQHQFGAHHRLSADPRLCQRSRRHDDRQPQFDRLQRRSVYDPDCNWLDGRSFHGRAPRVPYGQEEKWTVDPIKYPPVSLA